MIPTLALLLLVAGLAAGCASSPDPDARYAPTQNVLEVVSVLRLHTDDDTYRFPPARDFAGKNVYRASLARLENLEEIHAAKFRSGYMVDVILFAKGRALERIAEYGLAFQHYSRVSQLDSPLAFSAAESLEACRRLEGIVRISPELEHGPERAMETFNTRARDLVKLREEHGHSHYGYVIDEELERLDRERAAWFAARSLLDPRLDSVALESFQELIKNHRESKNHHRHLLELADYYATLSQRYVRQFPPPSLDFDPAVFDELAFGARRLYEVVSRQDGAVEKIEASRKLEAFVGFTLSVYDEKLPR